MEGIQVIKMVCITCLNNITPLNVSTQIFVDPQTTLLAATTTANNNLPLWLLTSMIVLFITFVWFIHKNTTWNLDIIQSIAISSFFIIVISYTIIKAGLSNNIVPLTFFGIIWFISIISMIYIKKKG